MAAASQVHEPGGASTPLADVRFRVRPTTRAESFDPAPPDGNWYGIVPFNSREKAIERLDPAAAPARQAVSGTDDAKLMDLWSLR